MIFYILMMVRLLQSADCSSKWTHLMVRMDSRYSFAMDSNCECELQDPSCRIYRTDIGWGWDKQLFHLYRVACGTCRCTRFLRYSCRNCKNDSSTCGTRGCSLSLEPLLRPFQQKKVALFLWRTLWRAGGPHRAPCGSSDRRSFGSHPHRQTFRWAN